MSRKYKGMNLEDHQEMAKEVCLLREKSYQILSSVLKSYGIGKRASKDAEKVFHLIDQMRCHLDDLYYEEIRLPRPDSPYYPCS